MFVIDFSDVLFVELWLAILWPSCKTNPPQWAPGHIATGSRSASARWIGESVQSPATVGTHSYNRTSVTRSVRSLRASSSMDLLLSKNQSRALVGTRINLSIVVSSSDSSDADSYSV